MKAASNCKILNPEVLRFEETDGTLWVKAIDHIHIENDYLGYTIRFWLEECHLLKRMVRHITMAMCQFIDKSDADDSTIH